MFRVYNTLIFLIIGFNLLQAQEIHQKVKISKGEYVSPGVYLLQPEEVKPVLDSDDLIILKRLGEDGFIIKVKEDIPFSQLVAGEFYEISHTWKLSSALALEQPKSDALYSVHTTDATLFQQNSNYAIQAEYEQFFVIHASPKDFSRLVEDPLVTHIDRYYRVKEETPVLFYDLSVNRINLAHRNFPNITGEDLKVSIKEQFFDTTDIDIRNRYAPLGREDDKLNQHATLMATLISGAGNSGSSSKGVAPRSTVISVSYNDIFPASEDFYLDNNIFVENHSYGGSIATEYGNEAAAFDQLINKVPHLVHVFSAGNSGLETPEFGPYKGIGEFANLTGNYKTAKNVLTIGAIDQNEELIARSSKGPTSDRRIKPEFVAYALSGTSDAAALVSGSVLLLQDLFLRKEDRYPSVALIKALLIAGARDVGAENIDYSTGYGNIDLNKSLNIIENGTYFNRSIEENSQEELIIQVPQGVEEMKLALSWIDPSANPGDEITLINDLDLKVEDVNGQTWLPWVLKSGRSLKDIQAQAFRGDDSLNNAELITIPNPVQGTYKIKVTAEDLNGPQNFSIAYSMTPVDHFKWTYPTSADALVINEEQTLRWETTLKEDSGILEVKIGEQDWKEVSDSIDLSRELLGWQGLNESGVAQLRMRVGMNYYESEPFSISPELVPLILFDCDSEISLSWQKVQNATHYLVQNLGEKYMEAIEVVQDTSLIIPKNNLGSKFVSVVPVFGELRGVQGRAIDYSEQGVKCYYQNFFARLTENAKVSAVLKLSTSQYVKKVRILKRFGGEIFSVAEYTAPLPSGEITVQDEDVLNGYSQYYAEIELENGIKISTHEIEIHLPHPMTLTVYPNPVKAGENLTIISRGDDLLFEIFDIQGRRVEVDQLLRFTDKIQMRMNVRGVYFVRAVRGAEVVGAIKLLVY